MNALIYSWSNYIQNDLEHLCSSHGVKYEKFQKDFANRYHDDAFVDSLKKKILDSKYDFLISINYWPLLAEACYQTNTLYIAWCCDCPLNIENVEDTLYYSTNLVFLFDRNQFLGYDSAGFETVYYLPLGVCKARVNNTKFPENSFTQYACDISFVGSLYESQLSIVKSGLNEYTKGYLDSLVDIQSSLYGSYIINKTLPDSLIDDINKQYNMGAASSVIISRKGLNFALATEITRNNRLMLLCLAAKHFDTRLYSFNSSPVLKDVKQCGVVDYYSEMPLVFRYSRINLCPCLRAIETGIPLRVYDIMGFGGFLLCNYQQELAEYFIDGEDMVMYDSYEDALEKMFYYTQNDDIRSQIAINGCKKVLESHTLEQRFEQILNVINSKT